MTKSLTNLNRIKKRESLKEFQYYVSGMKNSEVGSMFDAIKDTIKSLEELEK